MSETPEHRKERLEFAKLMRQMCVCGYVRAEHGALPPHTRGDECSGFQASIARAASKGKGDE